MNEIIFCTRCHLCHIDMKARDGAGSRSEGWTCSETSRDFKHIFSPALTCAVLILRNIPCLVFFCHPPSWAGFAWLMSSWYLYSSLRISEVVDLCHISHSATFSLLPLLPLLFGLAGMGWRALPQVSVRGQQCPPGPGSGEHSSPTATAAYLLSSSPAGQWWWWQPSEAAHKTHPTGREYTDICTVLKMYFSVFVRARESPIFKSIKTLWFK